MEGGYQDLRSQDKSSGGLAGPWPVRVAALWPTGATRNVSRWSLFLLSLFRSRRRTTWSNLLTEERENRIDNELCGLGLLIDCCVEEGRYELRNLVAVVAFLISD